MSFGFDVANLVLFCAQQFGVAAGVGAQAVMMVAYFGAMRDGVVDNHEAQFLRAARRVSLFGLIVIIASGILITGLQFMGADAAVVFSPAYLFKWLLIIVVLGLTVGAGSIPKNIFEALIAANWFALFLVHSLAPVATWLNLLELWAVWLVGSVLCWYATTFLLMPHEHAKIVKVPGIPAGVHPEAPLLAAKASDVEARKSQPVPVQKPAAPKTELPKIVFESKPAIQLPPDLQPKPMVTALPESLNIKPTDIPMPAEKITDTPFLPKVPPLLPIPTPAQAEATPATPKAPDAAPQLQKPEEMPKPPADSIAIHVMPKSPDQLPKT